jgi:thiol-disulfide isomerase/thioredoxin
VGGVLVGGGLASLRSATAWINSPALTEASVEGKVVLVQFWTFTCVNWLRTLPYVRAWADRYRGPGLVVIGVHTPEFSIEHDVASVRRATAEMKIEYPVAVDNDYSIWQGFSNQYWPAVYLLDGNGSVRYTHFGEGAYGESERAIQQLLTESHARGVGSELTKVEPRGAEVAADWPNVKSPESYVGYAKTEGFASPGGAAPDRQRVYTLPNALPLNHWALEGDWTMTSEFIRLHDPDGRIEYCFHARDLNLVMGPPANARPVRFRVLLDGRPPGAAHGFDVEEQGTGVANEQRLFQLIRQPQPIVDRVCRIEFLDPGLEAYVFTFG